MTSYGQVIAVSAVEPRSYAALVAGTPFPAFPTAAIGTRTGGTVSADTTVPVLASPAAATFLGRGPVQLDSLYQMGPFTVRVAGILSGTPAQPGRRGLRRHAARDRARRGRPARAQPDPGHRPGHRPRPAHGRGRPGVPGRRRHLPQRRAGLPGRLAAPARRGAHHRAHHRHGRRVRPVHRDPRPGARVGRARADPGPADRHGPRADHRAGPGRDPAGRAGGHRGGRRLRRDAACR